MSPRLLATATRALRESGSREIPIAAARIGVVGEFRRQVIGILLGILSVPFASYVLGLNTRPYLFELLAQLAIAAVMGALLMPVVVRTVKGDPLLGGRRYGLVVITSKGLRLFSPARRRTPAVCVMTLPLDDLAFAHIEPRRSIFDLPRLLFGHPGGAMTYEVQGKDVLQLVQAIQRLEEIDEI